jgi:alpha-mannosidase
VATADEVPGLGARAVVDPQPVPGLSVSESHLENAHVRVELADDGTLARVLDKRAGREVLDGRGNQLWAYVDKPRAWDAWDVDAGYPDQAEEIRELASLEVVERGPHRAAIRLRRRFRSSVIEQDIRLWANSPRVELRTRLDWHDRRWLLKARFPVAVRSPFATFETAFGVVARPTHRNTSWDAARFEVAGHRFMDLSEPGYGVALLNDGKYGHDVLGSELGLSLLRSPVHPDPLADEGEHLFTYALCPHPGSWLEGGVLAEAEDLNQPLRARTVRAERGGTWQPLRLEGPALALGCLKPLEDGDGLVLRVYEPQGARGTAALELPERWRAGGELDLLERPVGPHDPLIRPFQVRSWRLEPAR